MTRRDFLLRAVAWGLLPARVALGAAEQRTVPYSAEVGILYGALNFRLAGTAEESVDRAAGRYEVKVRGQGDSIESTVEGTGLLRDGRWVPTRTNALFLVYGRESRTSIDYDYDRHEIAYRSRSETFFLRRVREADDRVAVPPRTHVDDVLSAILNYADAIWRPEADGALRTYVVRRQRVPGEGPDDVQKSYRAELVPLALKVEPDRESGRTSALFDMTRFSSWAREDRPARIVFGADRRPLTITASLMLGTTVSIRFGS